MLDRNILILIQKIYRRLNQSIKHYSKSDTPSSHFEIKMLRKVKKMVAMEVKRTHNLDLSQRYVIVICPPNDVP
jgi:hypothetical protein